MTGTDSNLNENYIPKLLSPPRQESKLRQLKCIVIWNNEQLQQMLKNLDACKNVYNKNMKRWNYIFESGAAE